CLHDKDRLLASEITAAPVPFWVIYLNQAWALAILSQANR
ncbi:MAG: hypothetical protein ACI9ON_001469, partial [Limisphaerales bacterium]